MTEQEKQEYLKELREKQLLGSENLTQTPEIIKSREEKQSDLDNLEEATIKFFNNNQNEKMV